jgi:hypothetical protein
MLVLAPPGHFPSFDTNKSQVESRCGAVVVGLVCLLPPLSFGGAQVTSPSLRFHIPLIEPDMQIARIRLSDKTSRLHPRHVVPKSSQAYETEVPVQVREWIRYSSSTEHRHGPGCPRGKPCRTACRSDTRLPSSLSRVTPSAASEHFSELIGCPISCPSLLSCVCPELRPLPHRVTRLNGITGLSVTPLRPAHPSRASGWSS